MERKTVSSLWRTSAVILGLCAASLAWERHLTRQTLKNVFLYEHHITLVDAETGEIVRPVIHFPEISSSDDIMQQRHGVTTHQDGTTTLSGMACRPQTILFEHKVYQPEKLTLRQDSPYDKVLIRMKREGTSERPQ